MELPVALAQLRGVLDDSLTKAAERLAQDGAVSDVRVLQAGAVVTGIVAARRVYLQRRGAGMESECSCGEPAPCVHAVAVLMVAGYEARRSPGGAYGAGIEALSRMSAVNVARDLPAPRQRLYYLVDAAGPRTNSGFRISVFVGYAAAEEGAQVVPASVCPFALPAAADLSRRETLPRYIDDEDREILEALEAHAEDAALLLQVVCTGRAFWQALRGEPMQVADLAYPEDATPETVQRQSLGSLKAKLAISADGKATVHFVYNGLCIDSRALRCASLRGEASTVKIRDADVVYEIERDVEGEERLQASLDEVIPAVPHDREAWLMFMLEGAPRLQSQGWEIAVDPRFPCRIATAAHWYADLQQDGRQREWFDLRLGVTIDGHDVNLLPALVQCLEKNLEGHGNDGAFQRIGEQLLIRLDDGRYLPVAMERVQRIAATLVELFDRNALNARQALPVPAAQASRLAQLSQDLSHETALRSNDAAMLALLRELGEFSGIAPLEAPADFPAALRAYQEQGLGWLQFLRRHGLGGILADDMGLGKTVQTLAHLAMERTQGRLRKPALIVAPVSVIGNWQKELARFCPGFRSLILHGSKRRESFALIDQVDVVVTGYPQLLLDGEELQAREFSFVILDEAQAIKNPRAQVSRAVRALRAGHRLCLTGTPMENHLGDLWSLLDFVQPGLLGDEPAFARHYRTPIEKNGDASRFESLTRRIAPFVLRRTKDAVARDLPARTQIVESLVIEERQRDLYDSIRLAMHRRVREVIEQQGLARSRITVLDALLKLRQACCDPRLVRGSADVESIPSAKMEWLTTMLPELVAEGRRILLFSQFTSMLRLIEAAVAQLSIPYLMLTGATRERHPLVERFQAGEVPLFLISLKAGGFGLNLTAADTVIHYDPWWNPAVQAQATDRAHRIGQDKPVFVHKLVCQNTVEEKILQLQADKQSLASRLYAGQQVAPGNWDAAELEALFGA